MKAAQIFLVVGVQFAAMGGEVALAKRTSLERLQAARLKAAHEDRLRLARERRDLPNVGVYNDYRAVMHVHAEDADHTKGTRAEVLAAAKKTGVQAVFWTDHRGPKSETWRGLRDGVLFIAGSEDGNGQLRFPEYDELGQAQTNGGLRFLCHIEERYEAGVEGLVGMEICNRHTEAILDTGLQVYLAAASKVPLLWRGVVDAFRQYPDEFFGAGVDYRRAIMAKWDKEGEGRVFTGIGANDAHQNQVFDGVTFDPYEVSFRNLSTHILARELTESALRQSLREGRVYVSHDWLCDPTGFGFGAVNNLGVFGMGDTVALLGKTRLVAVTPVSAKLKLKRGGEVIGESAGTNLTYEVEGPGGYRLEAWLAVDGEERPWIYANPIYVKRPGLELLQFPSSEISTNVEVAKGINYVEGAAESVEKHRLDVYRPKGEVLAPVFLFLHGGAWRSGDRGLYVAVGNRFGKEGVVTVIPSYRLAPRHAHPAQVEDAAAALAWVVREVGRYGGDTNRIYVGGHSAGGHLAALLALDRRWLEAHGLSAQVIRGVVALSGVYNLTVGESQSSVFGTDPVDRRKASPLFHIGGWAPPFLVTYCQWDYFTLPAQAREFHAGLVGAGIRSELVFIAGENHISEMVHVPNAGDPTAGAVLRFMGVGN